MKMSVIIGVSQMLFGLACKYSNSIYFRRYKDLFFEAIPETIFLLAIFGYLVVIIFIKWATPWVEMGLAAPSLLGTLLDMMLKFYKPIAKENLLYEGQHQVQMVLIALALASVPILLLVKPILILNEKKEGHGYRQIRPEDNTSDNNNNRNNVHGKDVERGHGADDNDEDHDDHDSIEVYIHQVIHTLEYVLGCVSNTASYLRLWALSLAHSQLSDVFWERIVINVLEVESNSLRTFMLVGAMTVWAVLTFAVLLGMEMMSAALHDIRLHWVEFQNKFYAADGIKFAPLSFRQLDSEAQDKLDSDVK